jgi:hypothetical protein
MRCLIAVTLLCLMFTSTAEARLNPAFSERVAPAAECDARPVVEEFMSALNRGDLARLDQLFAREGEGWNWYSVGDRAGQRLIPASHARDSLSGYFASRIAQHEHLSLISLDENGNGHFGLLLTRRADDLRDGEAVQRGGKGWVSCSTGQIGVFSLGGAPPPRSFESCPRGTLPITRTDLGAARVAVLLFVRDTLSEMWPGLDLTTARVTRSTLAVGNAKGNAARVKCGRSVQRRTAIIEMRFPRVDAGERLSSSAFYVSRIRAGWVVWRLIT